ncbi:MAG: UDP-N-acetylmuramoyl-L-alanyl-D-glutamate--2,6-diaminopimelate ligase [Tissierellia bacterium]|nr:UDP-N-acetylmuramoyl-L-alanyl-D-glutamate--2,6-diaminopimelate ligase [Tissierellia bacterium]
MIKIKDILDNISYKDFTGNPDQSVKEIKSDSRKVKPDDIFIAIYGFEFDGHKFIDKAIANGAKTIVYMNDIEKKEGISYIKVEDDRKAFAEISNFLSDYPSKNLKVFGVTGSNGKTTTATMIYFLLEKLGINTISIGTEGSYYKDMRINTPNTTPEINQIDKILKDMAKEGAKAAVIETSSHALYLKRVYGIEFDYGVFTNLSKEHLDFHKSMDNYFMAKMILLKNSKKQIVNIDDPYGKKAKEMFKDALTVSIKEDSMYKAYDIDITKGLSFKLNEVEFFIPIRGKYNIYNALEAIAVINDMGYSLEEISKVFREFKGLKARYEYVENDLDLDIIIDFAHTPYAFEKLLDSLSNENIYFVYGINGDRNYEFRYSTGKIVASHNAMSIITMDDPKFDTYENIAQNVVDGIKAANGKYILIKNRKEAIKYAITHAPKKSAVVMLGKGEEDFIKIIGNNKLPYSERKTIKEVLEEI